MRFRRRTFRGRRVFRRSRRGIFRGARRQFSRRRRRLSGIRAGYRM